MPKLKEVEQDFLNYVNKMEAYKEALGLIYWDLRTGAPKNGIEQRSKVIGVLSSELFLMSTSQDIGCIYCHLIRK